MVKLRRTLQEVSAECKAGLIMNPPHLGRLQIDVGDWKTRIVLFADGCRTTMALDLIGRVAHVVDPFSCRATIMYPSAGALKAQVADQSATSTRGANSSADCDVTAAVSATAVTAAPCEHAIPASPTFSDLLLGNPVVYKELVRIAHCRLAKLNAPLAWQDDVARNAVSALAAAFRRKPALNQRVGARGVHFAGWLVNALCNFCKKELIKHQAWYEKNATELSPELLDVRALAKASSARDRERVQAVLAKLSEYDRKVMLFVLANPDHLGGDEPNYTQLGEELGVCSKTAFRQWQHAKDRFREIWISLDS